jgi:hypothetical protein
MRALELSIILFTILLNIRPSCQKSEQSEGIQVRGHNTSIANAIVSALAQASSSLLPTILHHENVEESEKKGPGLTKRAHENVNELKRISWAAALADAENRLASLKTSIESGKTGDVLPQNAVPAQVRTRQVPSVCHREVYDDTIAFEA